MTTAREPSIYSIVCCVLQTVDACLRIHSHGPNHMFKMLLLVLWFFCFYGPMVIFIYLFSHLVFYLFGPLDSVYWTSAVRLSQKNKEKSLLVRDSECFSKAGFSLAILLFLNYHRHFFVCEPLVCMVLFFEAG